MLSLCMGVFSFLPRDLPPRAVSASVQICRALSSDIMQWPTHSLQKIDIVFEDLSLSGR